MQKILVSIRGPKEALAAARGGAHITDVEYPASALGTPYPLNVLAVRNRLNQGKHKRVLVSTNIGEKQNERANACQAALGVATAGADLIKCGLAELNFEAAVYLGDSLVRTIKKYYPNKKVYPAVFVDKDMQRFFKPFEEGIDLIKKIKADGLLIDTFNKLTGKGFLDYCKLEDVMKFVKDCHRAKKEAWIAGSITKEELPDLWATGVDVICVRGAACARTNSGRFGEVKEEIVQELVNTIPRKK